MAKANPKPAAKNAAGAKKATDKKAPEGGALATGDLPLEGGKDGTTKALDNSRDIKKPVPVEIINKAKLFAQSRDRMDVYKEQATKHGGELLDMMLKEALPADVRIRVDTDRGVRFISYKDTGVTLVVENAKGPAQVEEKKADAKKPEPKKDADKDKKPEPAKK